MQEQRLNKRNFLNFCYVQEDIFSKSQSFLILLYHTEMLSFPANFMVSFVSCCSHISCCVWDKFKSPVVVKINNLKWKPLIFLEYHCLWPFEYPDKGFDIFFSQNQWLPNTYLFCHVSELTQNTSHGRSLSMESNCGVWSHATVCLFIFWLGTIGGGFQT